MRALGIIPEISQTLTEFRASKMYYVHIYYGVKLVTYGLPFAAA